MLYFLIGFMGSGKTYWGRRWSGAFGLEFQDLDDSIEREQGKSISEIFEKQGEASFRKIEARKLRELSSTKGKKLIVACGGGTACYHRNMRHMNGHGTTIFLKASAQLLTQRLLPELGHRPILAGLGAEDLPGFIQQKLSEREPYYLQSVYHFNTAFLQDENFKKILDKQ